MQMGSVHLFFVNESGQQDKESIQFSFKSDAGIIEITSVLNQYGLRLAESCTQHSTLQINDIEFFAEYTCIERANLQLLTTNSTNRLYVKVKPEVMAKPVCPFKVSGCAQGLSQHSYVKLMESKPQRELRRISLEELSKHNTENDCWISLNGDVYDISDYLKYHPGGKEILLKFSGKEAIDVFNKFHPWVNYKAILQRNLVGFLVKNRRSISRIHKIIE